MSNYYKLKKKETSVRSIFISILKLPISLPQWLTSFFLARTVTNIALNPTQIKKQRQIHLVSMEDDDSNQDLVIINVLPHESYKKLKDFLLKASTVIPLPFITKFKQRNLQFDNTEDKAHVDRIINEIDLLVKGNSKANKCLNKKFDWNQLHFKGLEKLDLRLRGHFLRELEKRYGAEIFSAEKNPILDFFTLETADEAVIDSVAVLPPGEKDKPMSERKFVIACLARDQNYINWIKDFNYSAQKIGCTVIGFNYRGICYSKGMVWTQKNMVEDTLAQVQRLIELGAKPENIGLEGMCLGAAVATLTAAQLHEMNYPVKLYNQSSFRSILRMITGYILPEGTINYYNPLTYLRYLTVAITYLFIAPIIRLAGWHMDAASAWDRIPFSAKDYSIIRPAKSGDDKEQPTDGVIHDSWASIASYIDEKRAFLKAKQLRGELLNDEELEILHDSPSQHYFYPSQSTDLHGKAAHFIHRSNLIQDTNSNSEEEEPQQRSNHEHLVSSFRMKFGLTPPPLRLVKSVGPVDDEGIQRPLVVAVSGGGGHLTAAKAIIGDLENEHGENLQKPLHKAFLYRDREFSFDRFIIWFGVWIMSIPVLGAICRGISRLLGYPALPDQKVFWQELRKLELGEISPTPVNGPNPSIHEERSVKGRNREYVDMLLDIYEDGYEYASIYNGLQVGGKIEDLPLMTKNKALAEKNHYSKVYAQFLRMLITAADNGQPYTQLISTQVLSLGALCDAVRFYNLHYIPKRNQTHDDQLPSIYIHQYMTDLPSIDCTHYYESLGELNPDQKQQMYVHAVNISQAMIEAHLKGFKGICNIDPQKNPMVRAGFKDPNLSQYLNTETTHKLSVNSYTKTGTQWILNKEQDEIEVAAGAKVATIMIGSLASHDSLEYLKSLLNEGYDKIVVFGGLNDHLFAGIQKLVDTYPLAEREAICRRIVRLGNQGDKEMAPIMTRSNTVVIGGGGLTVMEQMALPLLAQKTILINHKDRNDHQPLSTGVVWEDGNVNKLIEFLSEKNVFVRKTTPRRFKLNLLEAKEFHQKAGSGHHAILTPKNDVTFSTTEFETEISQRVVQSSKKENRHLGTSSIKDSLLHTIFTVNLPEVTRETVHNFNIRP
jgi:effector protein SdbA